MPTDGPKSPEDRKFVTALSRGLEVLRCFGPRDRWLANQEMARRTGLAKPTVSRLAYTLTRLGHLRYSETLNKYALGSAAISLGFAALGQMDVRRAARPFMQELSDYTKASVHLAVNDQLSMQVVDTYWNSASFVIDIGSRVPVATTSLGRAWVAALPPAERTPHPGGDADRATGRLAHHPQALRAGLPGLPGARVLLRPGRLAPRDQRGGRAAVPGQRRRPDRRSAAAGRPSSSSRSG